MSIGLYGSISAHARKREEKRKTCPVFHVDGTVGDGSQLLVVGDNDERLAKLVAQVEEQLVQFGLVLGVETARRLIGKDHGRFVDQGSCHGHTLLLTAREFVGLVVGAVGESQKLQQLLGARLGLAAPFASDKRGNHDVLQGRKLRQKLVELEDKADMAVAEIGQFVGRKARHVDAVDGDRSTVGAVEGAYDLQQRGLAGTRRANDRHDFALANV